MAHTEGATTTLGAQTLAYDGADRHMQTKLNGTTAVRNERDTTGYRNASAIFGSISESGRKSVDNQSAAICKTSVLSSVLWSLDERARAMRRRRRRTEESASSESSIMETNARDTSLPPSGGTARLLTVISLLLPIALPAAVFYARRARQEAATSSGNMKWPSRLIDRPLIFYVVGWVVVLALVFGLMGLLSAFFDVSPV